MQIERHALLPSINFLSYHFHRCMGKSLTLNTFILLFIEKMRQNNVAVHVTYNALIALLLYAVEMGYNCWCPSIFFLWETQINFFIENINSNFWKSTFQRNFIKRRNNV